MGRNKTILANPAYVVVEVGFEYNDEIYRQSEGEGGEPLKVFKDVNRAEREALRLTVQKLASSSRYENLGYYGYDTSEVIANGSAFERAMKTVDPEFDFDSYIDDRFEQSIPIEKMTPENQKLLIDSLRIKFYKVVPVELDD